MDIKISPLLTFCQFVLFSSRVRQSDLHLYRHKVVLQHKMGQHANFSRYCINTQKYFNITSTLLFLYIPLIMFVHFLKTKIMSISPKLHLGIKQHDTRLTLTISQHFNQEMSWFQKIKVTRSNMFVISETFFVPNI